jgi:hypothetical protein
MKIKDVRWKPGFRNNGVSPEAARSALDEIRRQDENNEVKPAVVVAKAKNKDHALHPIIFKDTTARSAYQWRKHLARKVIGSIEIIRAEGPVKSWAREFEITVATEKTSDTKVYQRLEDIAADPEKRELLLARAVRDAMAFRKRFKVLHEFYKVFDEIDRAVEAVATSNDHE